jgi:hypothetical protein
MEVLGGFARLGDTVRFHDLPSDIQLALRMLFPGTVLRIPRPAKRYAVPLEERIRQEHDANLTVYEMTESESVHALAKRHRMTHGEVRRLL